MKNGFEFINLSKSDIRTVELFCFQFSKQSTFPTLLYIGSLWLIIGNCVKMNLVLILSGTLHRQMCHHLINIYWRPLPRNLVIYIWYTICMESPVRFKITYKNGTNGRAFSSISSFLKNQKDF